MKIDKNKPGECDDDAAKELSAKIEEMLDDYASTLEESAAWQRKEGKNENGGLNAKGIASYRREHPGSKLQTAVTTKPSKLKPGSKDAKRRKSFCARMGGMKGPMKDEHGKPTRKALALRKWNCESVEQFELMLDYHLERMEMLTEGKTGPGLWANIHAKQERIKHGSNERMRKPGSKGAPTAQNFRDAAKDDIEESLLDKKTPSVATIAKKHNVSISSIKKQLKIGKKVETEHTSDKKAADEIARDHLGEKPDYYKKLKKYVESRNIIDEERMPLEGHPYHKKSDAELHYIIKDASEAAKAMKGHSPKAEEKYLDQVNDASTVLYYRKQKPKNEQYGNIKRNVKMIKEIARKVNEVQDGGATIPDPTPAPRTKKSKNTKNDEFCKDPVLNPAHIISRG